MNIEFTELQEGFIPSKEIIDILNNSSVYDYSEFLDSCSNRDILVTLEKDEIIIGFSIIEKTFGWNALVFDGNVTNTLSQYENEEIIYIKTFEISKNYRNSGYGLYLFNDIVSKYGDINLGLLSTYNAKYFWDSLDFKDVGYSEDCTYMFRP